MKKKLVLRKEIKILLDKLFFIGFMIFIAIFEYLVILELFK